VHFHACTLVVGARTQGNRTSAPPPLKECLLCAGEILHRNKEDSLCLTFNDTHDLYPKQLAFCYLYSFMNVCMLTPKSITYKTPNACPSTGMWRQHCSLALLCHLLLGNDAKSTISPHPNFIRARICSTGQCGRSILFSQRCSCLGKPMH
jgi:hypothetical protein